MTDKTAAYFKARLEAMLQEGKSRLQHLKSWSHDGAAQWGHGELSSYDQHTADAGSETYERARDLGLQEEVARELQEVQDALERLASGEFGLCQACSRRIPVERLEVLPTARFCVQCAQEQEEASRLAAAPALRPSPEASLKEGWRSPAFGRDPHAHPGVDDEGREEVWDDLALYPNADSYQDDPGRTALD